MLQAASKRLDSKAKHKEKKKSRKVTRADW
jgi:hypothetical protein